MTPLAESWWGKVRGHRWPRDGGAFGDERSPKRFCSRMIITMAGERGQILLHQDGAPPCVIFHPMGAMMPKLLTMPHKAGEISWEHP